MPNLNLYVDAKFLSPYAMSAFVALSEKELAFFITPIDISAGSNHEANYATASITSRVPTLIHDDFALSESSAIDEYIDEVFSGVQLFPKSVQYRARARQVQAWLHSDLMPIRQERSTEIVFCKLTDIPLSTIAQYALEKLFFVADILLIPNSENLFGEWCIADVDMALMLNRLVQNGDVVPERLDSYAKRQWQRPSVQFWINQKRT